MAIHSFLFCLLMLTNGILAGEVVQRQASTTDTATTAGPTSALIETTIGGTRTTVTAGPPTVSPSSSGSTTSGGSSPSSTSSQVSAEPSDNPVSTCHNTIDQPICEPKEAQVLNVGNIYWVQWNPTAFPAANSTVMVALQYTNETSRVAWASSALPTERGYTTVAIDGAWLEGWDARNFTLVWMSYSPGASTNDPKHTSYNVTLAVKPAEHLPAPPPTKAPDRQSLLIALPVALGAVLLVVLGLFCGMRSHRKIGLGSVMGRGRRGYDTNKSRRERTAGAAAAAAAGGNGGATPLEDRDNLRAAAAGQLAMPYHDEDEIAPAPSLWDLESAPRGHVREASLGSLVDEDEPNAFRREIQNQKIGR